MYSAKQLVQLGLRLPEAPFFDAIDFVTFARLANGGAHLECPDCNKQFIAPSINKSNGVYDVHCPHCHYYFGSAPIMGDSSPLTGEDYGKVHLQAVRT